MNKQEKKNEAVHFLSVTKVDYPAIDPHQAIWHLKSL